MRNNTFLPANSDLRDDELAADVADNESSFFDSLVYADRAGDATSKRVVLLCARDEDQSELKDAIISDSESCEDKDH